MRSELTILKFPDMQSNHQAVGLSHHSIVVTSSGSAMSAAAVAANRAALAASSAGRVSAGVAPSLASYPTSVAGQPELLLLQPQSQPQQISLQASTEVSGSNSASPGRMDAAQNYIATVKRRFAADSPAIYSAFVDMLRDFKAGVIDPQTALARVRQLFRSHPDLLTGFLAFLPSGVATTPLTAQTQPSKQSQKHQEQQQQQQQRQQQQQQQQQQHEEFNHAIAYVNKIKSRFAGRSVVYKQFLEILHRYQKEQRAGRVHCDTQVMTELGRLFGGQSDLLDEFAMFLPNRQQQQHQQKSQSGDMATPAAALQQPQAATPIPVAGTHVTPSAVQPSSAHKKRPRPSSPSSLSTMPKRRALAATDSSNGPLSLFDSRPPPPLYHQKRRRRRSRSQPVRAPLPTTDAAAAAADAARFDAEAARFLERFEAAIGEPEVFANFLRCLNLYATGCADRQSFLARVGAFLRPFPDLLAWLRADLTSAEDISRQQRRQQQSQPPEIDSLQLQIDGGSYRAAPRGVPPPRCSGRDHLPPDCRDALNDTLVSFPSWLSEDSQGGGRRNAHEEACCRVEDERYELDMVLEVNKAAVRALESTYRRLQRLTSADELARYRLGDDLCGGSAVLQRQAIYRVYGDKAQAAIQCMQENPAVAVPLILRRLKAKAAEWREAHAAFNNVWREQVDKNYARSLDHQGQAFKLADLRQMRTRALVNEIATKPGQMLRLAMPADAASARKDAIELLTLQARRLTGVGLEERAAMKRLLRRWLCDVTADSRIPILPGDEDVGDSRGVIVIEGSDPVNPTEKRPLLGNITVYSFLRLFHMLAERIAEVKAGALATAAELAPTAASAGSRSFKIFSSFMYLATSMVNGNLDPATFEDRVRDMLGSRHYRIFTLDRLLSLAVRQLHILVTDEPSRRLLRQFYLAQRGQQPFAGVAASSEDGSRRARLDPSDSQDQQQQQQLYHMSLNPQDRVLTIRLLQAADSQPSASSASIQQQQRGRGAAEDAAAPSVAATATAAQHWCRYLQQLQRPDPDDVVETALPPIFLARNRRRVQLAAGGTEVVASVSCWDWTELRLTEQRAQLRLVQAAGCESLFHRRSSCAKNRRQPRQRIGQKLDDSLRRLASAASPSETSAALAWLLGETPGLLRPGLRTVRLAPGDAAYSGGGVCAVYQTSQVDPTASLWPSRSAPDLTEEDEDVDDEEGYDNGGGEEDGGGGGGNDEEQPEVEADDSDDYSGLVMMEIQVLVKKEEEGAEGTAAVPSGPPVLSEPYSVAAAEASPEASVKSELREDA